MDGELRLREYDAEHDEAGQQNQDAGCLDRALQPDHHQVRHPDTAPVAIGGDDGATFFPLAIAG